ncbi:MAG: hypothetical protein ACI82F_004276 [Planctomycetota bacterium]|jgi:hypothetical protein
MTRHLQAPCASPKPVRAMCTTPAGASYIACAAWSIHWSPLVGNRAGSVIAHQRRTREQTGPRICPETSAAWLPVPPATGEF